MERYTVSYRQQNFYNLQLLMTPTEKNPNSMHFGYASQMTEERQVYLYRWNLQLSKIRN